MNERTIAVTSVQLQAHDRDAFDSVWPDICTKVQRAAEAGAQLIVLPEGTVPGYVIGSRALESSVTERALADMQAAARRSKAVIVYGSARHENGQLYNSAYVIDADGSIAGVADKCFLWHFDRRWFTPGRLRAPVRTSLGTLGVMICADGRIPTIARSLVDDGAEILVMPTAWVTSGRNRNDLENIQADLLAQVRARENGVPFVAANKAGVEQGCVAYCGKSQIIDARGSIAAIGSQYEPELLSARVELSTVKKSRPPLPQNARPVPDVTWPDLRVAVTPRNEPPSAELLSVLGVDVAIGADGSHDRALGERAAVVTVEDAQIEDPGGLVPHRLGGKQLIIWRTASPDEMWNRKLARARAVELRVFVVCIAPQKYAFAADPDGTIVCGTFDSFETAAFAYAPQRTQQTLVAPGTDVIEGLEQTRRDDVRL